MPADVMDARSQPIIQRAHNLSLRARHIGQHALPFHVGRRLHGRADHAVRRHGDDDQVRSTQHAQISAAGVQGANLARGCDRLRIDVDAHDLPGHRALPQGHAHRGPDQTHTNDAHTPQAIRH